MYKSKRKAFEDVDSNQREVRQKVSPKSVSISVWYDERTQFKRVLNKCGFKLSANIDQSSVLSIESMKFIKGLSTDLNSGLESNGSDFLDEFFDGFMRYVRVKDRLQVALMPTQLIIDENESAETVTEDSLIRLLLKIDVLQVRISTIVLQKLSEVLKVPNSSDTVLAKLIINQFRFLEHVVDSEVLCEKFFELIKISKGQIQLELLMCLPELADDNQHESLASNLSNFMKNARDIIVPILDTIGNLSFGSELLLEIRHIAISMLNEFHLKDIPIVLKFLFGTVNSASDSEQLFMEIRGSLDMLRVLNPKNVEKNSNDGVDSNCISVLETFLKYQKHILDGAVRYLDSISSLVDIKVFDFIVLLILLNTAKKKTATAFIKQTIRAGAVNDEILDKSCKHLILKRYFKLIYELCENLTRSFEPVINNFGCLFYRLCFSQLDDFYRQEIIGALVTHVGSGCETECTSALTTLDNLINVYPKDLCQFSIFLKNILEFLPFLNFEQVRKVYSLLGKLASVDDSENGCILDELNIIIRKNIAGGSLRQRANGVLCAVMLFQNLIKKKDKEQHALELIEFCETNTSDCSCTQSLLYDELSSVIKTCEIESSVLKKLKTDVADLFENVYLCKDSREIKKYNDDEAIILGVNDEVKNFAVRISPLSFKKSKNLGENENLSQSMTLAPTFRLLSTCEMLISNNLTELVEILDSPLIFLKKSIVDDSEKDNKELICRTIFHTVNWLRELINTFSQTEDEEYIQRLVERLRSIVCLQKELEKCLKSVPSFAVPIAGYYDKDKMPILRNVSSQKPAAAPKKKHDKGRVTRKKNPDVLDKLTQLTGRELNTSNDGSTDSASPKPGTSKISAVSSNFDISSSTVSINVYYRELEFDVFNLLNCNLSLNSSSQDVNSNSLLCDDLVFLLDDLVDKVKHRLPPSTKRSCGFLKVQSHNVLRFQRLSALDEVSLFNRCVKLLPSLLRHLDSCKNYFKAIIDENDGIVDCATTWSRQSLLVSHCFDSIVECLNIILSWHGHGVNANKDSTKIMFKHFSNFFSSDEATVSTVHSVANRAINFFSDYVDFISNLSSATNFLSLMSTFSEFGASEETKQKISEIAVSCLKREWTGAEGSSLKGAKSIAAIKSLLRIASSNTNENLLTFVEKLIQSALSEAIVNESFYSETYKTLNKTTFGSWYDSLFIELINGSKKIENLSDSNSTESIERCLLLWVQASRQFNFMTSVLKKVEMRAVFVSALQQGKNFVNCFVQNCMNVLDHSFADSYESVQKLLKLMQTGTRLLQTLCMHSKIITKDKTLAKYVPPLKKSLEEFVYRVKAMMAMNNCETALSIGVLKTKNLQGEELLSQKIVKDSEDVSAIDDGDQNATEEGSTVIPDSEKEEEEEEEEEREEQDEEEMEHEDEEDAVDDDVETPDYSESY